MNINLDAFSALLQKVSNYSDSLYNLYDKLPLTSCNRKANCCGMLPDASLIEALVALKGLTRFEPGKRMQVLERLVCYFLLNPVEITPCPFLEERECLIYRDRFFGCRAYGLWSKSYYKAISNQNRLFKISLQQQWKKMGVSLPEQVISFHLPYCSNVQIVNNVQIDDAFLTELSRDIEKLSDDFSDLHDSYSKQYFGDLSFFIASLFLGYTKAIQMKFDMVSAFLKFGDDMPLKHVSDNLYDILGHDYPV